MAFPFDGVDNFGSWSSLAIELGVKDGFNFVFLDAIDFDCGWWWLFMTRDGVFDVRFKKIDMEYGVNEPQSSGEFEPSSMSRYLFQDLIRPYPSIVQLLHGSLGVDVVGVKPHLASLSKTGCWYVAVLGGPPILFNGCCQRLLQVSEEGLKIVSTCARGFRQLGLGISCHGRMVALVGKEGGQTSRSMGRVVVGEFSKWK